MVDDWEENEMTFAVVEPDAFVANFTASIPELVQPTAALVGPIAVLRNFDFFVLKLLTLRDARQGQFGGRRRRHRGAEAQLGGRDNAVEALRHHHRGLGGKVRIFYVYGSP